MDCKKYLYISHHQNKIYELELSGNKLWNTFNDILGQKYSSVSLLNQMVCLLQNSLKLPSVLMISLFILFIYFIADHIAELVCHSFN